MDRMLHEASSLVNNKDQTGEDFNNETQYEDEIEEEEEPPLSNLEIMDKCE